MMRVFMTQLGLVGFLILVCGSVAMAATFTSSDVQFTSTGTSQWDTYTSDPPSSFDARDEGWVTPVKNQSALGACWTFAINATMESSALKQGLVTGTPDFSEWYMANYAHEQSKNDYTYDYHTPGWGENLMVPMWYAQDRSQAVNDSAATYPLTEIALQQDLTASIPAIDQSVANCTPVRVSSYQLSSGSTTLTTGEVTAMKNAVTESGALTIGMRWTSTGTISDVEGNTVYRNTSTAAIAGGHAVTVVGWDDNVRVDAGDETKTGAFLVKNSWGTGWGDSGYFYLAYDNISDPTGLGTGTGYSIAQVDVSSSSDIQGSYNNMPTLDGTDGAYPLDLGSITISDPAALMWGRSDFATANFEGDAIDSIGIVGLPGGTEVSIYIMDSLADVTSWTLGNAIHSETVTIDGDFQMIELSEDVEFDSDNLYVLYHMPVNMPYYLMEDDSVNAGVSYVGATVDQAIAINWTDMQNVLGEGNDYMFSVSMETVPEPGTMILLGLGSTMLLKRRKQAA